MPINYQHIKIKNYKEGKCFPNPVHWSYTSFGQSAQYNAGLKYFGFILFRFGNNTEKRRNDIQNGLIHDKVMGQWLGDPSPHFKVTDRSDRFYFQLGNGGGYLW